jgi:uncharacterized membrane protein
MAQEKNDKRAAKKAAVLGTENEKKSSRSFLLIFLSVLMVTTSIIFTMVFNEKKNSTVVTAASAGTATQVSYPISLFDDGKAKYFEFTMKDITVKYFIIKSSDGIIRAAFDACDVCWPEGKGYYQEGDFMVCRNCGRRFASVLVNEIQGGCNPAPLKRKIENGRVTIKVRDIIDGSTYFNFKGKV